MMFHKILIANRGEIAVRIIRACKEMGIQTAAVFSEADRDALHTQMADEAVCIGPPRASESYLNMANIISAACLTKSEAIHPGFGFLAENSTFAAMCRDCSIRFIGPDPETIDIMGDKANARKKMEETGVPVIPGSSGLINTIEEAEKLAVKLGFPVMLKAAAGGGGKGIRPVGKVEELESQFYNAQSEAKANFGNGGLYMEKIIENARHIEVQILGDNFGNVIHLGERDCSLQRRNQKMLEEAPSIAITDEKRKALGEEAVKAAKAVGYKNAGTIEFLYDKNGRFYFMEMNTRIQVEHPVTEMITGIDIVKEQIRIAAGEPLSVSQDTISLRGHAIECRINAEDPSRGFAPAPGKIQYMLLPSGCLGLRVDSAVYPGYYIPPYYDSMIAKLIVLGDNRQDAIAKMKRALEEFVIEGVSTNVDFQLELINHPSYLSGEYDTGFIMNEFIL